jgi:hypothetical protein
MRRSLLMSAFTVLAIALLWVFFGIGIAMYATMIVVLIVWGLYYGSQLWRD